MTLGLAKAATVLAFLRASLPTSAADDQADLDKRRAAMRTHFQEEMGKLASPGGTWQVGAEGNGRMNVIYNGHSGGAAITAGTGDDLKQSTEGLRRRASSGLHVPGHWVG